MRCSLEKYRSVILTADSLLLLLLGLIYAWSIFVAPLEAEFNWSRSQTSLVFSIGNGITTIASLTAAVAMRRIKPQIITIAAGIMVFFGFMWASNVQMIWELYLSYGVMCCFGIGMAYNQVLATVVLWFQDKSGHVSGIVMMCYGIGSLLFGTAASWMVANFGWRFTFRATGILCLVILTLFSGAVRRPTPEQAKELPQAKTANKSSGGYSILHMVKDPAFWLFSLRNMIMATIGLTISGHAAMIAQETGTAAKIVAFFVGAYSVANGLGRLFFGALFDKMEQFRVMNLAVLVAFLGSTILLIAFQLQLQLLVLLAFMALGLAFGSSPISSAAYIKNRYGDENYGANLGFANLCVIIAAYIGPYFGGLMYQQAGYGLVIISLTVYSVLSFALTAITKKASAKSPGA